MIANSQLAPESGPFDESFLRKLSLLEVAYLAAAVLLAGIVFCGWSSPALAAHLPHGWFLMKFNTAFGLLLGAVGLRLCRAEQHAPRQWWARGLGLLVLGLASVALYEHATGHLTGFDTWLASDGTSDKPGLMALQTSLYLTMMGLWLLCAGWRHVWIERVLDVLTALLVVLTLIIFSGYCFSAMELFGQTMSTRTSPHTLACMLLLTTVLLARRMVHGYFSVFAGQGIGSQLARRVLPVALLMPFVLMVAGSLAARRGWLLPSEATGLTVTAIVAVLAVLVGMMGRRLNRLAHELRESTLIDDLTGIHNQRGFMLLGEQSVREAARSGITLTILAMELDGLREVNERFGHPMGSQFVLDVAKLLRDNFKRADILARIGGSKFAVVTRGAEIDGLIALTRIGEAVDAMNRTGTRPYHIGFSVGEATSDPGGAESLEDLLAQADLMVHARKLYEAEARA